MGAMDGMTYLQKTVVDSPEQSIGDGNTGSNRVQNIIDKAKMHGGQILDLSCQGLTEVPESVFSVPNVEFLYFEGNKIVKLPENFFERLPNLKWLDLRYNRLIYLPSAHLGAHASLKTILLQGNNLRNLPLELGLIETLKGLSLSENPLEFPPSTVLEQGTDEVLKYLREYMLRKSQGEYALEDEELNRMAQLSIRDNDDSGASTEDENPQRTPVSPAVQQDKEEFVVQPRPAALHQPISHFQVRQQFIMKKTGKPRPTTKYALQKLEKERQASTVKSEPKSRHPVVTPYPEPPPASLIEERAQEETRKQRIREIKEKQESILQRRRNDEVLKDFRQESKQLQNKKYRQHMKRGEDYSDTAHQAPYGFEDTYDKVRNKEDLHKHEVRLAHEKMSRPMSPGTKERLEAERAQRDRELEKKVKHHTASMVERRKKSRGTAHEEMEAARREMEIGLQLERELQQRKRELEYRFQAFTGDAAPTRLK